MIRPSRTLDAIYGPGTAYSGHAHREARHWLPRDPAARGAMSGGQVAVAGAMPMVVDAGVATPAGLELLREAGLPVAADLRAYREPDGYQPLLDALVGEGRRIVVQHRHPLHSLPREACWVDPDLLAALNDKAELARHVPMRWLPQRAVHPADAADWPPPGGAFPHLLKAATPDSTGGGVDVVVVRDPGALEAARAALAGSPRIVAEDWLDATAFLCLNFILHREGRVEYLGAAEMPQGGDGQYLGNWLGAGVAPGEDMVAAATEVAAGGLRLGFHGVMGMDAARLRDGSFRIFDLNYRLCGSTVPLLVHDAACAARGASVSRFRGWRHAGGDFAAMAALARRWIRAGRLVPLATFDPVAAGVDGAPRLGGLLLGDDRRDVARVEAAMAAEGLA